MLNIAKLRSRSILGHTKKFQFTLRKPPGADQGRLQDSGRLNLELVGGFFTMPPSTYQTTTQIFISNKD